MIGMLSDVCLVHSYIPSAWHVVDGQYLLSEQSKLEMRWYSCCWARDKECTQITQWTNNNEKYSFPE